MDKQYFNEQKAIMEMGISKWGESVEGYHGKHGYEVAADALGNIIKKYGEYNRNQGGVSYHRIVFKTPITSNDTKEFGYKDTVEVRLTYWGEIMCHHADKSGIGSKHPWAPELRLLADKIEEAIS